MIEERNILARPFAKRELQFGMTDERSALHTETEISLRASLPAEIKAEVALLEFEFRDLVGKKKVAHGLELIAQQHIGEIGFSFPALKTKFRNWMNAGRDWAALVNKAKVPNFAARLLAIRDPKSAGCEMFKTLPTAFIQHWQMLGLENKRKYAPAYKKLIRSWANGEVVPGFGTWREAWKAEHPGEAVPAVYPDWLPEGWSYGNLMRYKPSLQQELMARQGQAAARKVLPHILSTRVGLRFLEEVMFDDVKLDWRIIDEKTGTLCDLWILVAHDRASDVRLVYGMRPARMREDGSQEHLKQSDMKQLSGLLIQRWGLPPYVCRWKVERGTATYSPAAAAAIRQISGGRIEVHWTAMIGGIAPSGFREKAIGNSRGKGTLESGNNLLHNETGDEIGQTGRRYDVRPAELVAREKEVLDLVKRCTPDQLARVEMPVLTISQAKARLDETFARINNRTDHSCEGFDEVVLWRATDREPWMVHDGSPRDGGQWSVRSESPLERAAKLMAGMEWSFPHPSEFTSFFEDSHRLETVRPDGEISFTFAKKDYTFAPASPEHGIAPGTKLLCYFHPEDLSIVNLCDPRPNHGGYIATWARRERVGIHDKKALANAFRHTHAAREMHTQALAQRHAAEARGNEERRARNEVIIRQGEVGTPCEAEGTPGRGTRPTTEILEVARPLASVAQALATVRNGARKAKSDATRLSAAVDAAMAETDKDQSTTTQPRKEATHDYID